MARATARTKAERERLLAAQGGVCACCGRDDPGNKGGWHLDHDHACCDVPNERACGNCWRGTLCHYCNVVAVPAAEDWRLPYALNYLARTALDLRRSA